MSKLDELGLNEEYKEKQPGLQQYISKPTQRKYQPFGGPMQRPVQQQPEPIDYGYEVEPSFDNVFDDDLDAFSQTKEQLKYVSGDYSSYSQSAGLAKDRYNDFLENKFKPFYQEIDSLGTFKNDSADDYLKSIDDQYNSYKKASQEEDGFTGPSDRKKFALQEMGKYAKWNQPNGLRDQYLRLKSDFQNRQAIADQYRAQKVALQDRLTSIPMSVRMDMEKQISAGKRAPRSKKATDEMLNGYSWEDPIYDLKTGEVINIEQTDPRRSPDPIYDLKTGKTSESFRAQKKRLGSAIKGDIDGVLRKRNVTGNERKLRDRGVMFSQNGLMDGRPLGLSRKDVDALDLDEMRKAGMKSYQGRPLEEVLNEIGGEERLNMAKVMQAVYAAKSASESAQIEYFKYAGGPKADEYKKKMETAKESVNKTLSLAQEFGLDNELFEQAETTGWFSALGNAFKRGMLMDDMADYTPDFLTNTLSQDEMQNFINAASEIEKLPTSSALQRYQKVKSDGALEAFGNLLFGNPLAIPEMFVESLSSFLPATFKWGLASAGIGAVGGAVKGSAGGAGGMLAGAAAGGSLGARAGWAAASFTLETSGTVLEGMQDLGIDWKNPKVFAAAWNNEATRSAIVKRAVKKGIPIAIMDGISAGMAGKMSGLRELGLNGGKIIDGASWSQNLRVASAAAPRFTKWQKTNNVLTEVGADSLLGTAGEFFGQAWSKEPGEAWDWDAIAAEGVIGVGPGFAGGFMEQMRNQSNDFTDAPIQYSEQRTTPDGTTGVINRAGFQATYNTFNSADGMTSAILNMAGIDDANMADEANAPKAMAVQDWIANMWLSNPDKMANLRVIVADRTPFADMDNEGSFEMDDDGNGVIYMNRNKLNQDPIAAFMHEAGHMARYSMFDNEELLDLYEGLSMDDKLTAFAEYYKRQPGKKFSDYNDVEQREIQKAYNKLSRSKGPLAVADEWFSFQFVRVLSGGKPDPSVKSDLQGWLQKYAYPFMQKYAGDEKVAGSKKDILNAKILAYMGRTPRGFDPNTPRFDNMPGSETDFSAPGIRAPKGANVLAGLTDAEGLNHLVQQIKRTHPGNPRLQLALAKDTNSFLDKNVLPTNISFWTKAERQAAEDVAKDTEESVGGVFREMEMGPRGADDRTAGERLAQEQRTLDELLARGRVQEIREADFAEPDITETPADTDPARQQEAQKARSRRQKEDRKSGKATKYTDDLGGMDTGARVGQSPFNREREREQYEQGNRFRVTLTMPGFRGSESRVEYFATRGEADAAVAEFEEKENRKRIRRIRSRHKRMRTILSSPKAFEKFYDENAAKFDEGTSIHTIIAKAFGLENMMADSLFGEAYVSRHLAEDRVHGAGVEGELKGPSMREVQEALFLADQEVENAVELLTNREAELVKQLDVYTTDADKDKRDDVDKTLKLVRDYREALIPESKAFMWGDMPHPFFFVDSEGKERVTLGMMAKKSSKTAYYMADPKNPGKFVKKSQSNPQEVLFQFISGGFDKTREGAYRFLKQYDISPEEYDVHLDAALASVQKAQDLQNKSMGYMPISKGVEVKKDVPGGFQEKKGTNYFLYATYLAENLEKKRKNKRPLVSANPEMEELAMFNVAFGKSYEDRGGDYPSRRMYRYFSLLNRTVEEANKQMKAIVDRIAKGEYAEDKQRDGLVKSAMNLYDYQKKLFPTADEIAQYAEENQYFPKVQGGKLFSEAFSEWMYYDEMLEAIDKYFDFVQSDIAQGFSPVDEDFEAFVEQRRREYEGQQEKADDEREKLKYVQKPLFAEFPKLDVGPRTAETEVKKEGVFYVSPEGLVDDHLKVDGYDYREPGEDADDDIKARAGVHSGFKRREVDRGFNVMKELFKAGKKSLGEIFKSSVPNRYETTFITDFVQPREGVKVKFEYAQDLKDFPSQKVKEVTAIWKTDKFGVGAWYYGKSNKQLETRMTTVGGKSLPTQLGRAVDEAYMIELDRAIIGSDQSLNEVSAAELAEFIFKQGKSAADIARIPSSKNKQDQSGGPGGGLLVFVWEAFIQDAYKRLGIGDFEKKVNVKEYIDPIATDERTVPVGNENLIVQVDENGRAAAYRQGADSRTAVDIDDEAVALLVQAGFGTDAKAVAEGLKSEAKGQKLKAPAPAAKKDMSNVRYKNVTISYKANKFYVDGKLVNRSLFAESNKSPDFDYMQATLAPIMQAVIDARRVDIYGTSQGLDKVTPNDPVRREAESQKDGVSEDVPEGMYDNTETETDTSKSTVQKATDQEEGESTVDTIRESTEELPSTSSFVDSDNNVVVLDTIADRMGASSEPARAMRKKLYNLKKGKTKDLKLMDVIKLFKNDEVLWKAFDMPQPKGNVMDAKNPFASFEKEIRKHKNFDKFEARILKPGTDSIRASRYVLSSGLPDMYGQLSILNRLASKAGFDKEDRDKYRKLLKSFDLKTSLIDQADPPKQLVTNFLKSAGIKSQELIDAIDVHGLWHQYYGKGYTTVEHSVLEFINPIKDAMAKHSLSNERFGEYLLARAAPSRNMRLLNMYKEELKDYEPGSEKHKALSKMIEERKDDLSGIKTSIAIQRIKEMEADADIKGFINDASNPLQKFYDMNKEALRLKSMFGLIQTEGGVNEYKAMVRAMSMANINGVSSVQMKDNYNYAPMQGFEGETDTLFDNDEAYETVGKSSASSGQGWDQPKYKFLQQGAFGRVNTNGRQGVVAPDPNSVFATAQSQYYDAAIRSHKNEVSQAFGNLYEIMRAISYPELYEGINSPLTDELKNLDDVAKAEVKKEFDRIFDKDFINEKTEKYYSIEEKDIEVDGEKVEGLKMRRRTLSTEMQNNPYVFIYRTNGEPRFIKFKNNEHGGRMASSMKNLKYEALPRLLQAFNVGTRFLARMFTSLNPAFIIPNFIRDLGTAAIHLSETDKKDLLKGTFSGKRLGGFAKAVFKAEQAIAAGESQKLDISIDQKSAQQLLREGDFGKMYQFAKQAGAKIGYFRHKSIPELITDARDIKDPSKKGAMKRLKAVGQYVDSLNTAVENSIRMSAFWSAIEAGRTPQQAATIARNVTVDFNQKGNLTQAFGSLFVFFGASMNSAHRMARTLKNRTPEERLALIGGIVSASFLTAFFNRMLDDDEDDAMPDYDKISTYKRDTNLIIPGANKIPGFEDKFGKDTGFFSIPLPLGYNVFWALGQTAADIFAKTVQGRGGIGPMDFITRNLEANLNAFNPIGGATLQTALIPTAGKPIIEMYANKNFMGSPIRNEDIQFGADKPAHLMDPKRTQEHFTELSKLINSAMGGDDAVKGSIGGLFGGNPLMASKNGDYQFDLSGSEMEHLFLGYTGGPGAIANMIFGEGIYPAISKKEYDITVDKMPIANRFVRSTTYGSATRRKYYQVRDAVLVAKSALNKAKAKGSAEVALVKNKYGAFLSWEQTMKGVDGRLSKIRDQKAKIEANKSMPHSEKAQRIEELDRKGLNMLTASIKKAQSLGIS